MYSETCLCDHLRNRDNLGIKDGYSSRWAYSALFSTQRWTWEIRPPQNWGQFFTVPWVSLIPRFHCILSSPDCVGGVGGRTTAYLLLRLTRQLYFADNGHIGASINTAKEWADPGQAKPAGALQQYRSSCVLFQPLGFSMRFSFRKKNVCARLCASFSEL